MADINFTAWFTNSIPLDLRSDHVSFVKRFFLEAIGY